MRITLDIPDRDLRDILRYSGEEEEGVAVAKLLTSQLMLRRRRELSEKPMVERIHSALPDWAQSRDAEKGHWPTGATAVPTGL